MRFLIVTFIYIVLVAGYGEINASRVLPEDLIDHTMSTKVSYVVKVVGGVVVYCEPSCYPTEEELLALDPKWRVAIGVHPKMIGELTEDRFNDFCTLD